MDKYNCCRHLKKDTSSRVYKRTVYFIRKHWFWGSLFLYFFIFSLLIPITGDDFSFLQYKRGLDGIGDIFGSFLFMYQNLNGRVLGNGLQLLLVDYPLISATVRAFFMWSVAYLAVKIARPRSDWIKYGLVLTVFVIPVSIFAQTYAWQSGFFNYVTSTAAILAIIYIIMKTISSARKRAESKEYGKIFYVLAPLVLAACLFVENVTIAIVTLALAFLIYALFLQKNIAIKLSAITVLAASALGALIMFSSPVYTEIVSGGDPYRGSAKKENLVHSIAINANTVTNSLAESYLLIIIVLSILTIGLIFSHKTNINKKIKPVMMAFLIFYPIFIAIYLSAMEVESLATKLSLAILLCKVFLTIAYFLFIFLASIYFIRKNRDKYLAVSLLTLSIVSILPFAIVTPFGPRNLYLPYILMAIFAALLANIVLEKLSKRSKNQAKETLIATLAIVGVFYIGMFSLIKIQEINNKNITHQALKEYSNEPSRTILLKKYPFNHFLQDSNNEIKTERYINNCEYKMSDISHRKCKSDLDVRYR